MKFKNRLISIFLIILLFTVTAGSIHIYTNHNTEVEFETESLNNYLFGYMSWGVKKMGLDTLQEKFEKSGKPLPEVKVAVIDSGLNTDNKYIKGRYTNDGYNFINNSTDIYDEQYHGTMVSGIIADGTSSNVKVMPIKVNDKSGKGNMKNVAKGIFYAIEHGADVINLSISSEDPNHSIAILDEAIDAAVKNNVVVVAAAGNQKGDTAFRYPANKDNVLTITSVDKNGTIGENANTGAEIDFALPGVSILAAYKKIMMVDTGTSLAAPHASAAAALLKTWNKSLNQNDIKEILKKYSVDLGDPGFDNTYGWGMIDLSGFDINSQYTPTEEPTQPETEISTEAHTQPESEVSTEFPSQIETQPEPETTAPTQDPTYNPAEYYMLGDTDLDGSVTVIDSTFIQRFEILAFDMNDIALKASDVDSDGSVCTIDATFVQRHASKIDTPFPIGTLFPV